MDENRMVAHQFLHKHIIGDVEPVFLYPKPLLMLRLFTSRNGEVKLFASELTENTKLITFSNIDYFHDRATIFWSKFSRGVTLQHVSVSPHSAGIFGDVLLAAIRQQT